MRVCVTCDRETRPKGAAPDGRPEIATSAPECAACYRRRRRAERGAVPRSPAVSRTWVLEDYRMLRAAGVPTRFMPSRVGMTPEAFERAMYRARRAGDPRAADFKGLAA
jgi:hypothetical protein